MIRVAVNGAAGRMGRMLVRLVCDDPELELAAAIERPDNPIIGIDAGVTAGVGGIGVAFTSEMPDNVDALIDFSSPAAGIERLPECIAGNIAIAIGTTGFDTAQWAKLESAAQQIPLMVAPNMSVGVNIIFEIAADIARRLGPNCDIEIIEAHHNQKKDAPSGTALAIARHIADAIGVDLDAQAIYGREGLVGARPKGEIGIHSVRGGDIVGDHTIIFAAPGERIELKHQAHSRDNFGQGALRAVKFLVGKPPGSYSMKDVLA